MVTRRLYLRTSVPDLPNMSSSDPDAISLRVTPEDRAEIKRLGASGLTYHQARYQVQRTRVRAYQNKLIEGGLITQKQLNNSRNDAKSGGYLPVDPATVRPYPLDNRCEFCGQLSGKNALHMDHEHLTGRFRAWLCGSCNGVLGWVEKRGLEVVTRFLLDGSLPTPKEGDAS